MRIIQAHKTLNIRKLLFFIGDVQRHFHTHTHTNTCTHMHKA